MRAVSRIMCFLVVTSVHCGSDHGLVWLASSNVPAVTPLCTTRALQVPRLTAVLRALTTEHGKQFDPDAAFIQRQQLLDRRLQQQQQSGNKAVLGSQPQGTGLGRSRLAQQLLGDWATGAATAAASPQYGQCQH
jgi:hypothetical protein